LCANKWGITGDKEETRIHEGISGALGNNKEKGDPFSKMLSSFSFLLDLLGLKKCSVREFFFSSNRLNGVSKDSSFYTDFKNLHFYLSKKDIQNKLWLCNNFAIKICPSAGNKKSLFFGQNFFGALFTNVKYRFLKSV
jgi:hypothetical protein